MENKIKQKLIRSLKELKIYQKLKQKHNFNIRINCINVYELINHYIINFISNDERKKLLNNFDALKINTLIPFIKIKVPTEEDDLILLSNYFDKNGILWASGDKFSKFTKWKGRAKIFDLHYGSYISYNNLIESLHGAISVNEFIQLYDGIKEEVNKLCV